LKSSLFFQQISARRREDGSLRKRQKYTIQNSQKKKNFHKRELEKREKPQLTETRVSATQQKNGPKPRLLSKLFHSLQVWRTTLKKKNKTKQEGKERNPKEAAICS
jgi:hypothetical protein